MTNDVKLNFMVVASHPGLDGRLDARIERRAGRLPLGAGFDCREQRRDVDFGFAHKAAAMRAARRIRALRGVRAKVRDVRQQKGLT